MKKYAPLALVVLMLAVIAGGATYTTKISRESEEASAKSMAYMVEIATLKAKIDTLQRQQEAHHAKEQELEQSLSEANALIGKQRARIAAEERAR